MKLNATSEKFILHWGEMGTRWGISRSVAQIHGLLIVAATAMTAEEIADTLGIARSNVSTSLKELQGWGVVKVVHKIGDRRDHFETLADMWEMSLLIIRERRRRELDPTAMLLRQCVEDKASARDLGEAPLARLAALSEFMELSTRWCDRAEKLSPASARRLAQLSDKFFKLVS
jgi:DNA-binding transcriptional regulator GbsR (MarR family)